MDLQYVTAYPAKPRRRPSYSNSSVVFRPQTVSNARPWSRRWPATAPPPTTPVNTKLTRASEVKDWIRRIL